jgi:hypothetical protein
MGRRTHYTHIPLARGCFERFLGWSCLPFREVGTGRGSGSSAALLRMTRFAMQECCYAFLVNSICSPFSKGQQNPEGRRGAIEKGLCTCWIGAFTEDQVKRILGISENIRVVVMLALGYPAEAPASRPRKKLVEIAAYDGWRS